MKNPELFQQALMQWYRQEARILPWRSNPSPYNVWISEIMLQQTRVDVVIPYFNRFIDKIPAVDGLARIDEEQLLKLWQGLGYYGRALNLKRAALMIMQEFSGHIPSSVKDLLLLPGIGDYTAGAIASIAYGKREPAVDGNVLRIIARVLDSTENINSAKTKKAFKEYVGTLLPSEYPGDFNQALMDLGAQLCIPNGDPKCTQCPISGNCLAYLRGHPGDIPIKSPKKRRTIEKRTVLLICHKGRYALRKRGRGLLSNLWEFPNIEGHLTKDQCRSLLQGDGMVPLDLVELSSAKHIFTHIEWHMVGYFIEVEEIKVPGDFIWATRDEIAATYSVPAAFKNYLDFGLRGN